MTFLLMLLPVLMIAVAVLGSVRRHRASAVSPLVQARRISRDRPISLTQPRATPAPAAFLTWFGGWAVAFSGRSGA
ncbi:hypothetical protein [Streptomyces bluensis]|uniref:hypothetical protein n=1 Tax=Streptomyces bluensis TaxID=33897 RepID=UPI003321D67B